jgi:hypothetical protein
MHVEIGENMAGVFFDTLKFANTLKSAGMLDEQAEAMATIYYDAFQGYFSIIEQEDNATDVSQKKTTAETNFIPQSEAMFEPIISTTTDAGFIALRREFRLTLWMAVASAVLMLITLILTFFIPVP